MKLIALFILFIFVDNGTCGKPFADAEWIPVLDMCEENCDELTEICVENDQLEQKCNKLPKNCSTALTTFVNPPAQWNYLQRIQQRRKQWENRQKDSRIA